MVVIRGVNVFPSAVENLVRRCDAIVEFRIRVSSLGEMSELNVEIELQPGTDLNAAQEQVHHEISSGLDCAQVKVVEPGSLPRFEMKAKRFLRSN